jgi:hypothetical protein
MSPANVEDINLRASRNQLPLLREDRICMPIRLRLYFNIT